MLLSEKVRVEIFIPDQADPSYTRLLTRLETELSYAFGGCTRLSGSGHFQSETGRILPDRINIIFTDVGIDFDRDRVRLGQYVAHVRDAMRDALEREEAILVAVYPVHHAQ